MTSAGRSDRAMFLAAVAVVGLVAAPLLHAEEHCREELEDEAEAWRAGSTDPLEALAYALEHGHAPRVPATERHRHGHQHGHSHGPASPGPHGSGVLSHLGIALHGAPELPELAIPAPQHAAPAAFDGQLRAPLRYLVPEWAQGPPAGC
jgi:hypothetical protein